MSVAGPVTTDPERERRSAQDGDAIRLALALKTMTMGISLLFMGEVKA